MVELYAVDGILFMMPRPAPQIPKPLRYAPTIGAENLAFRPWSSTAISMTCASFSEEQTVTRIEVLSSRSKGIRMGVYLGVDLGAAHTR